MKIESYSNYILRQDNNMVCSPSQIAKLAKAIHSISLDMNTIPEDMEQDFMDGLEEAERRLHVNVGGVIYKLAGAPQSPT